MNPAHLHIILNHIPVIGIPFGLALLFWGFLRKSNEVKRAGLLVFVAIALVTIPTFLTGKAAEDMVEHLPGVSENLIENHERAATIALIATSVLGGLALLRLLIPLRFVAVGAPMSILVFVFSLGVAGWLGRTAHLGGQIRHSEIRGSSTSLGIFAAREDDDAQRRGTSRSRRAQTEERKDEEHRDEVRQNEEVKDEESGRRRRGRGRGEARWTRQITRIPDLRVAEFPAGQLSTGSERASARILARYKSHARYDSTDCPQSRSMKMRIYGLVGTVLLVAALMGRGAREFGE